MRSFLVLAIFSMFLWHAKVMAESSQQITLQKKENGASLFRVELPKLETESLNDLMAQAMKIELIRLTGSHEILKMPEAKVFLKKPKQWLQTYGFEPRIEDGVKVGETVYFVFSEQRLYEAFQKYGLLVWPLEKRPKTWVLAKHHLADIHTPITLETLSYRTDIDFRQTANNLSLDLFFPATEQDWVLPNSEFNEQLLLEQMQQVGAQQFLRLDLKETEQGQKFLSWQLFSQDFQKLQQGEVKQPFRFSKTYFEKMLEDLIEALSLPYRKEASILGQVTLNVIGVKSFNDLDDIERFLLAQKPEFREVSLIETSANGIVLDIEYQGNFEVVTEKLKQQPRMQLIETNAFSATIDVEWQ